MRTDYPNLGMLKEKRLSNLLLLSILFLVFLSACIDLKPREAIPSTVKITVETGTNACIGYNESTCAAVVKQKRIQSQTIRCIGFEGPADSMVQGLNYTFDLSEDQGWDCTQKESFFSFDLPGAGKTGTLAKGGGEMYVSDQNDFDLIYTVPRPDLGLLFVDFTCGASLSGIGRVMPTDDISYLDAIDGFCGATVLHLGSGQLERTGYPHSGGIEGDRCDKGYAAGSYSTSSGSCRLDKMLVTPEKEGGNGKATIKFTIRGHAEGIPPICVEPNSFSFDYGVSCAGKAYYNTKYECKNRNDPRQKYRYLNCSLEADSVKGTFQGGSMFLKQDIPFSQLGSVVQGYYTGEGSNLQQVPFFMIGQGPTFQDFEEARNKCTPFKEGFVNISLGNSTFDPPELKTTTKSEICLYGQDEKTHDITLFNKATAELVKGFNISKDQRECLSSLPLGDYFFRDNNGDAAEINVAEVSNNTIYYVGKRIVPDYGVVIKGGTVNFSLTDISNHTLNESFTSPPATFTLNLDNKIRSFVADAFGEYSIKDNSTNSTAGIFVQSATNIFKFLSGGSVDPSGRFIARPLGDSVCFSSETEGLTIDVYRDTGGEYKPLELGKPITKSPAYCCVVSGLPGDYRGNTSDGRTVNWRIGSQKPSATLNVQSIGFEPDTVDAEPGTRVCWQNPVAKQRTIQTVNNKDGQLVTTIDVPSLGEDGCKTSFTKESSYTTSFIPDIASARQLLNIKASKTNNIKVTAVGFDKPSLLVKPGDKVCWINDDDVSHVLKTETNANVVLSSKEANCITVAAETYYARTHDVYNFTSVVTSMATDGIMITPYGASPQILISSISNATSINQVKFVNKLNKQLEFGMDYSATVSSGQLAGQLGNTILALTPVTVQLFNTDNKTHSIQTSSGGSVAISPATTANFTFSTSGEITDTTIPSSVGEENRTLSVTMHPQAFSALAPYETKTITTPTNISAYQITERTTNSSMSIAFLTPEPPAPDKPFMNETLDMPTQKAGGSITSDQLAKMREYANRGLVPVVMPNFRNITIDIRTSVFNPNEINVTPGSSVTLKNTDNVAHRILINKTKPYIECNSVNNETISCAYNQSTRICQSKLISKSNSCDWQAGVGACYTKWWHQSKIECQAATDTEGNCYFRVKDTSSQANPTWCTESSGSCSASWSYSSYLSCAVKDAAIAAKTNVCANNNGVSCTTGCPSGMSHLSAYTRYPDETGLTGTSCSPGCCSYTNYVRIPGRSSCCPSSAPNHFLAFPGYCYPLGNKYYYSPMTWPGGSSSAYYGPDVWQCYDDSGNVIINDACVSSSDKSAYGASYYSNVYRGASGLGCYIRQTISEIGSTNAWVKSYSSNYCPVGGSCTDVPASPATCRLSGPTSYTKDTGGLFCDKSLSPAYCGLKSQFNRYILGGAANCAFDSYRLFSASFDECKFTSNWLDDSDQVDCKKRTKYQSEVVEIELKPFGDPGGADKYVITNTEKDWRYLLTELKTGLNGTVDVINIDVDVSVGFAPIAPAKAEVSPQSSVRFNNYNPATDYAFSSVFTPITGNARSESFTVPRYGQFGASDPGTYLWLPVVEGQATFSSSQLGTTAVTVSDKPQTFNISVNNAGFDTQSITADRNSKVCFSSTDTIRKIKISSQGKTVTEGYALGPAPNLDPTTVCSPVQSCASPYGVTCTGKINSTSKYCSYSVTDPNIGCRPESQISGCAAVNENVFTCAYDQTLDKCKFKAAGGQAAVDSLCGGGCVGKDSDVNAKVTCSQAGSQCAFSFKNPVVTYMTMYGNLNNVQNNVPIYGTETPDSFCTRSGYVDPVLGYNGVACQPTEKYPDVGCVDNEFQNEYCYYTPIQTDATSANPRYTRQDNEFCSIGKLPAGYLGGFSEGNGCGYSAATCRIIGTYPSYTTFVATPPSPQPPNFPEWARQNYYIPVPPQGKVYGCDYSSATGSCVIGPEGGSVEFTFYSGGIYFLGQPYEVVTCETKSGSSTRFTSSGPTKCEIVSGADKCKYYQTQGPPYTCSSQANCPCALCSPTYPSLTNIQCNPTQTGCMIGNNAYAVDTAGTYCTKQTRQFCSPDPKFDGVLCSGPNATGTCEMESKIVEDITGSICPKIIDSCESRLSNVKCGFSGSSCTIESVDQNFCWTPEVGEYVVEDTTTGKTMKLTGYDKRTPLNINLQKSYMVPSMVDTSPNSTVWFISGDGQTHNLSMPVQINSGQDLVIGNQFVGVSFPESLDPYSVRIKGSLLNYTATNPDTTTVSCSTKPAYSDVASCRKQTIGDACEFTVTNPSSSKLCEAKYFGTGSALSLSDNSGGDRVSYAYQGAFPYGGNIGVEAVVKINSGETYINIDGWASNSFLGFRLINPVILKPDGIYMGGNQVAAVPLNDRFHDLAFRIQLDGATRLDYAIDGVQQPSVNFATTSSTVPQGSAKVEFGTTQSGTGDSQWISVTSGVEYVFSSVPTHWITYYASSGAQPNQASPAWTKNGGQSASIVSIGSQFDKCGLTSGVSGSGITCGSTQPCTVTSPGSGTYVADSSGTFCTATTTTVPGTIETKVVPGASAEILSRTENQTIEVRYKVFDPDFAILRPDSTYTFVNKDNYTHNLTLGLGIESLSGNYEIVNGVKTGSLPGSSPADVPAGSCGTDFGNNAKYVSVTANLPLTTQRAKIIYQFNDNGVIAFNGVQLINTQATNCKVQIGQDFFTAPDVIEVPQGLIQPGNNEIGLTFCNCTGGAGVKITLIYDYLSGAGTTQGQQILVPAGGSRTITPPSKGEYTYLDKDLLKTATIAVKDCSGSDIGYIASRIGGYERSDYKTRACDTGNKSECRSYNIYGPATIGILTTEDGLRLDDAADMNCASDQLINLKSNCPNCTSALLIGKTDVNKLASALSQLEAKGTVNKIDLIAHTALANDYGSCNIADIMNEKINLSKFALYNYQKPSVLLDFGIKPGNNTAKTCEWTDASISEAYNDFFGLWIPILAGNGVIGASQYCYKDACPKLDYYGLVDRFSRDKKYTDAWFKEGCGKYYYNAEGLSLLTFSPYETNYSLCDPSRVLALLQQMECGIGKQTLKPQKPS